MKKFTTNSFEAFTSKNISLSKSFVISGGTRDISDDEEEQETRGGRDE